MTRIVTEPKPFCPICGAMMILRQPKLEFRQDWEPFWGCTQYPDCRGKRNIDENGYPEDDYEEW